MISTMMFLLSLFAVNQVQEHPVESVKHDILSVSALADGMSYYQNQAIEHCWKNGGAICPAGSITLSNRNGSQVAGAYGSGYESETDGSTYVVTTLALQGAAAGRTTQQSYINSGIYAALKQMTGQSSSVGYYDKSVGGVILPDRNNEVAHVSFQSEPIQGQPVLYAAIMTPPPPVQVASIEGGSYSPLVPIPPTVTPVPISPAAVVSPPANVSSPEPVSPTYTPPATVMVNPIGPWAPSPVPPPPPPPPVVTPPPPPPLPQPTQSDEEYARVLKAACPSGFSVLVMSGSAYLLCLGGGGNAYWQFWVAGTTFPNDSPIVFSIPPSWTHYFGIDITKFKYQTGSDDWETWDNTALANPGSFIIGKGVNINGYELSCSSGKGENCLADTTTTQAALKDAYDRGLDNWTNFTVRSDNKYTDGGFGTDGSECDIYTTKYHAFISKEIPDAPNPCK